MLSRSMSSTPPDSQINKTDSLTSEESLLYLSRLTVKDRRRLENIYEQIRRGILDGRSKKIEVLERYNAALCERIQVEQEIKRIEGFQLKKISSQRNKQQALLLQLLKKRDQAKQKLKQTNDRYRKEHKGEETSIDLSKPEEYVSLVKERVLIQEGISRLEQSWRKQLREDGGLPMKKLQEQVQKLGERRESQQPQYKINVVEPQSSNVNIKAMDCNQIRALIFNWSIDNQKEAIYSLLKRVKYADQSFSDIEGYVLEQQGQKQAMFEDVSLLRQKLQRMQRQNRQIQDFLNSQQSQGQV